MLKKLQLIFQKMLLHPNIFVLKFIPSYAIMNKFKHQIDLQHKIVEEKVLQDEDKVAISIIQVKTVIFLQSPK